MSQLGLDMVSGLLPDNVDLVKTCLKKSNRFPVILAGAAALMFAFAYIKIDWVNNQPEDMGYEVAEPSDYTQEEYE